MPLLTDLLETFDTVSGHEPEGMEKIAPVACHVSSPKQVIDVILTKDGTFVSANVQTLKSGHTLVFQTEESGGRTGGCAPHALNDGLLYMTDRLSGVKDGAFGRYKAQLGAWADDPDTPAPVRAVRDYVETHDLADDLIGHGCLPARDLPAHKKDFVRWIVTGTEGESRTWLNPDIAQSWSRYYTQVHSQREHGLDAMTGLGADIEKNHPRAVRAFVKAKLMSVPSKEPCALHCGRAFQSESQCMQIGYVTSQKIHNALTWLTDNEGIFISSQNKKTRILVLWEPHFEPAKRQDASDIEAMFGITLKGGETTYQSLRDAFRKRLLMQGGDALQGRKVSLFAIDSATPGRLSATLYRSFMMPDFLEKLDRWQNTCRWHKSGFDLSQGTRAPSLYEIASCAYGTDRDPDRPGLAVSDALFIDAVDQLLRTVLSGGSIPSAMFHRLMIQVSEPERFSSAKWNWILRTACAVYHKKETDRHPEKGDQDMELDRNNESRSYLFGRLLAVYEQVEAYAVYQKNGKGADSRSTNAMRLWNSYVNRPYAAMAVLRKAVMPYLLGLHAGSRGFFENEMQEIVTKLDTNDPKINRPLSPDYMTGYFLERAELRKPKKTGEDRTDTEENTEESEYAEKKD